jgi:hypothetical protein
MFALQQAFGGLSGCSGGEGVPGPIGSLIERKVPAADCD